PLDEGTAYRTAAPTAAAYSGDIRGDGADGMVLGMLLGCAAAAAGADTPAGDAGAAERQAQLHLLRDVVGNPFRPVAPDRSWMPENAVVLARSMYETRDFAAMPLLADLLEEAGCPAAVSEHCRGPGPHVRGCWVVDLLLGRD